jgi:Zn-dependent M32 family carboxypeptidase
MINYAVGAVITAEIRKRTRESIGTINAGNHEWYPWTSDQLLKFGAEFDTAPLLERFLGRPLSAAALVEEVASIGVDRMANQAGAGRNGLRAQ